MTQSYNVEVWGTETCQVRRDYTVEAETKEEAERIVGDQLGDLPFEEKANFPEGFEPNSIDVRGIWEPDGTLRSVENAKGEARSR